MSSKSKGTDFERDVVIFLSEHNHFAVRCAGSKSKYFGGVVDVTAFDRTTKQWILIQSKLDGSISNTDKKALILVAKECSAIPVLAYKSEGKIVLKKLQSL